MHNKRKNLQKVEIILKNISSVKLKKLHQEEYSAAFKYCADIEIFECCANVSLINHLMFTLPAQSAFFHMSNSARTITKQI